MKSDSELNSVRRIALIVLGLALTSGFRSGKPLYWAIGVFGWLIVLAASGTIELGMALYYRNKRRRSLRHAK